jgi:hypothetical protein
MNKSASLSVANQVRELAKVHQVTADRDGMSRMAVAITRLADDIVELDVIEQLLVNLKKKGILTKAETLEMQGDYLHEKRQTKQIYR